MARIYVPGFSVHVIRRGNNRCDIFRDDDDRRMFLATLKGAADDSNVHVHAFVLMTTHYHALASPQHAEALPAMMKTLGERYVDYFNRKYDRIGTLWAGRYTAISIASERYWLNCLRYIEQNPVRAGIVGRPGDYAWSSYRLHALGEPLDWITEHGVYRMLGTTSGERQAVYRDACERLLTGEELALQRRPPSRRTARPRVTLSGASGVSELTA